MFDKAIQHNMRATRGGLEKTNTGRPLTTYIVKYKGAIAEPEHILPIKIFCQSNKIVTRGNFMHFDNWIFISRDELVISAFSTRRDFNTMDMHLVNKWIFPRFHENLNDQFIKDYPNGIIVHVMGLYSLQSYEHDIEYKSFPDGQIM